MQRWHLSLGLAALALGAAWVAPRLMPTIAPPPAVVEVQVPAPAAAGTLRLEAGLDHGAVLAGESQERFIIVSLSAATDEGSSRRPVDVGVVLDSSGSMSAQGKIDYAKRAAKVLAHQVEDTDSYALVTFSDQAHVVVPSSHGRDPASVELAVDGVYEGGGTNLYAGIQRGADEVRRAMQPGDVGRVIVLSDGHANAGVVEPHAFASLAASLAAQAVTVSTVGLGLDYHEDLLAEIADLGGGTYDFVDDARELDTVFRDELRAAASVVARNTSVRLRLPEGVELVDIIGWNAERNGSDWKVFVGDVYSGDRRKVVARVRLPALKAGTHEVAEVRASWDDLVSERAASVQQTVQSRVTTSPDEVRASLDRDRSVDANRAYGNWYRDQAVRAYEQGDRTASQQLLRRGQQVLGEAAEALDEPALASDGQALQELGYVQTQHAPASAEGRRIIKGHKERFRDLSR